MNPAGAGPGGTTASIACGATSCALPAEACCVLPAAGGGVGYACIAASATCGASARGGGGAALACSGAANCSAGTVCCVRQDANVTVSQCKAACGASEAQLCDPKAPGVAGCTGDTPCSSSNIGDWSLPPTYATCGGRGN